MPVIPPYRSYLHLLHWCFIWRRWARSDTGKLWPGVYANTLLDGFTCFTDNNGLMLVVIFNEVDYLLDIAAVLEINPSASCEKSEGSQRFRKKVPMAVLAPRLLPLQFFSDKSGFCA